MAGGVGDDMQRTTLRLRNTHGTVYAGYGVPTWIKEFGARVTYVGTAVHGLSRGQRGRAGGGTGTMGLGSREGIFGWVTSLSGRYWLVVCRLFSGLAAITFAMYLWFLCCETRPCFVDRLSVMSSHAVFVLAA